MPRVTDTVLDQSGTPVVRARVLIQRLVSAQRAGVDGAPGTPARTQLVWSGRTGLDGTYTAALPDAGDYTVVLPRLARVERFAVGPDLGDAVTDLVDLVLSDDDRRPPAPAPIPERPTR